MRNPDSHRTKQPNETEHPQPKKDEHTVKTQIPTKQDWRNRGIEAPETAAAAPEAPRECEHCGDTATKQIEIQGKTVSVCEDCDESLYEDKAAEKPAHTPRPWKIDENEELPLAVIQDNEDGEGVCEIGKPGSTAYSATPEQWANARLIAAAPELLNALKRVAECCAKEPDSMCEACGKLARAAIAAAEGSNQ